MNPRIEELDVSPAKDDKPEIINAFGFALDQAGKPYILVAEAADDGDLCLFPIEEHQAHGLAAMITAVLA